MPPVERGRHRGAIGAGHGERQGDVPVAASPAAANQRDVCVMVGMGQHQMLLRFVRRGDPAVAAALWESYKAADSGVTCEGAVLPWRK